MRLSRGASHLQVAQPPRDLGIPFIFLRPRYPPFASFLAIATSGVGGGDCISPDVKE